MKTQLEILLEFLKISDTELLNQVILDYWDNQNVSEFNINGSTYLVYTKNEIEDLILDKANDEAENLLFNLEELVYDYALIDRDKLLRIVSNIKDHDVSASISDLIFPEEVIDGELIYHDFNYYIFIL